MTSDVDVLIVGGGLTGSALAVALKNAGISTLIVDSHLWERDVREDFDARSIALSKASIKILQSINAWPSLEGHAAFIKTIHVSEQKKFGVSKLSSDSGNYLGAVVEMRHLINTFHSLVDNEVIIAPAQVMSVDHEKGIAKIKENQKEKKIKARLIVAADGTNSSIRTLCDIEREEVNYHQYALVTNLGLSRAHNNIAYERFTKDGPMALLPMTQNRQALVWSLDFKVAQRLQASDEKEFLDNFYQNFGYRLGRINNVGRRVIFPLKMVIAKKQVVNKVVLVGNAVHTLHPIAGQGFNLGLRDIAVLAECLVDFGINDNSLNSYQKRRSYDQKLITKFTHNLVSLFANNSPVAKLFRNIGLNCFEHTPYLKRFLANVASGYADVSPRLVCNLPLREYEDGC